MSKGLVNKMIEEKAIQISIFDNEESILKKRKQNALEYITAGNATFTIETKKYDEGYTYKMVHDTRDKCEHRYKVYRMFGADNENDYTFIGIYYKDTGTYKSKAPKDNKPLYDRLLAAFLKMLHTENEPWYDTCKFYKSINCAVCGRKLTTPESIERGIGPECYEKLKNKGV